MSIVEHEIPTLMPGDNLTREEFLRIWEQHPEIKHAELIGGIVYMSSPVSIGHGVYDGYAGTWLGVYCAGTPGTQTGHECTSFLRKDTVQPDHFLRILEDHGGKSWLDEIYLAGSPEMLMEICRSSVAYDLHQKYDLYQSAGVQEYLAVLLYEKEIRWHILKDGAYQLLQPDQDGIHRSQVFPGLWLDSQALLKGDMQKVLATLQQGLAAAEHESFVRQLAARKR